MHAGGPVDRLLVPDLEHRREEGLAQPVAAHLQLGELPSLRRERRPASEIRARLRRASFSSAASSSATWVVSAQVREPVAPLLAERPELLGDFLDVLIGEVALVAHGFSIALQSRRATPTIRDERGNWNPQFGHLTRSHPFDIGQAPQTRPRE